MATVPVDKVIEMAVQEPEFRQELLENPREALLKRGIDLDPEQIKTLESIAREDVGVVSDELSERLAKVSEVERDY